MLAEAITGALDLDDDGMVEQAVQQGGGDDGVAEDLAPFGEAAIGGEDHRSLFVAGVDELEEQVSPARDDGQVADLVDDQQCSAAEVAKALAQAAVALGFGERCDEVGERREGDAAPCLTALS